MVKFILKRLLQAIPVLLAVSVITFLLIHAAPGGPFAAEKAVPAEILKHLNERYKLDQPLHVQFYDYLKHAIQGDLGPSFKYPGRSVNEIIATGFPVTLELGCYALLFALLIGVGSGVCAALSPNTWRDYLPMTFATMGICLPAYVLGPLLVLVFGIWLEWLPVAGWELIPGDKILPSVTLGSVYAAYIARLSRGGMLETLSRDFIRTARAKGMSESIIIFRHAMRVGLLPVVSFMGPALAGLLSGSFVVETIFQIPGLGRYFVQGAFNRDYTLILGVTLLFASLIILFNLIADVMLAWLDPKVRQEAING